MVGMMVVTPKIEARFRALTYPHSVDGVDCIVFGQPPFDRYQKFWIGRASDGSEVRVYAHRFAYEIAYGPIPEGKVIDHICGLESCVNPRHLQAITQRQNVLRGQHPNVRLHHLGKCKKGHDLVPGNVSIHQSKTHHGKKRVRCRRCQRERTPA